VLGGLELLPDADHDEGQQHGVSDADHGIFEARDLVVRGEEIYAEIPAGQELQADAEDDGHADDDRGERPDRQRIQNVQTAHAPRSPAGWCG
jgi:hypothetical protein